ncbi:MAG: hypothetical protein LUG21_00230, partial [Clostridiales bacterium]|nr:hypothetical protein [Clostridiales bacterium]
MKKFTVCLYIFAVLIAVPANSFAADTEYLDPVEWYSDSSANVKIINYDDCSGLLQYFTDGSCFYAHLSYSEIHLQPDNNSVFIDAVIKNNINEYYVSFYENGI